MAEKTSDTSEDLYIVLISLHGLIRVHDPELGRDADTGGQTLYVLELARALGEQNAVARVDLMTRRVMDSKVTSDYAQPTEPISPKAHLVRIPFGPRRYLRKEALWPHLTDFTDNALRYFRGIGRTPDLIHSHYADAGLAATRLATLLGVPHVHTGHSLGRVKQARLLKKKGAKSSVIASRYNIYQRIEAEEIAIGNAAFVVTSTKQEAEEQYSLYENYHPKRMETIPPGIDLERFYPPQRIGFQTSVRERLAPFLRYPDRPIILALSRPDERKNIATLIHAFGGNDTLRNRANLVIIAGNREKISAMDKGAREVLNALLLLIDQYDLYGSSAYPKHHHSDQVPDFYRLAAKTRGLFVNPALTEPFGLTLLEAAASGLPVIATEDGGPEEILERCQNGLLIDPLNSKALGEILLASLTDRVQWRRWSKNGVRNVLKHFSWSGHVDTYLKTIQKRIGTSSNCTCWEFPTPPTTKVKKRDFHGKIMLSRNHLPTVDRWIICDIDNTLLGDQKGLKIFLEQLSRHRNHVGFGIATGRHLESAVEILKSWDVPTPDILITSVGSVMHYGHNLTRESSWEKHIQNKWKPEALREVMTTLPGLTQQPDADQGDYKISYFVNPNQLPPISTIVRHLRKKDLHARVIYSHQRYLDLLPIRASKGLALRYLSLKWDVSLEQILVAGDSGNDTEMLRGNTCGVVVGNFSPELEPLKNSPNIYFSKQSYALGILEGIEHYQFFTERGIIPS